MSTIIMSACWPLQGMSPAQKAVLVSLADMSNDDGVCWPSVAHIAMRTCLSERAVQNAIKWLCTSGLVSMKERSGRSTVYQITPAAYSPPQEMHPAGNAPHPRTSCTPPPQEMHPTPADAAPRTVKNHHRTVKEPKEAPAERVPTLSVSDLVAQGADERVATEFMALRKRKKAALTPLALEGMIREAGAAGISLTDAMRLCVESDWRGFKAAYVQSRHTAHETRADRDAKWNAKMNQVLAQTLGTQTPEIIDMGAIDASH